MNCGNDHPVDNLQELLELRSLKQPVPLGRILVHRDLSGLYLGSNRAMRHSKNLCCCGDLHVFAQLRFHAFSPEKTLGRTDKVT